MFAFLSLHIYNSIVFYTKEMFVSKTVILKPFFYKCIPKNILEHT